MAARDRHGPDRACPRERGQATVELALVLPLVVFGLLAILQVGLVVRDQVAVVHAAREAARAASVDRGSAARPRRGAAGARPTPRSRRVAPDGRSSRSRSRSRTTTARTCPLVGALFPDLDLHARAVMRVER